MQIFLICKVRGCPLEEFEKQREYVGMLEDMGHHVHWPPRDTRQEDPEGGTGICRTTFWAIFKAKEVHVLFDPTSQGFVADLMLTYALNELGKRKPFREFIGQRKVVIVNPEEVDKKIQEEIEEQVKKGRNPLFAKSYTMILKNLAKETEIL